MINSEQYYEQLNRPNKPDLFVVGAVDIETITQAHQVAIENPLAVLQKTEEIPRPDTSFPLQMSSSRGGLAVLTRTGVNVDNVTLAVVANCAGHLMNSHHYPDRRTSQESWDIIRHNEITAGPPMLVHTLPEDTFVFTTDNPQESQVILNAIADSMQTIGIPVSRNYRPVEFVEDWFNRHAGSLPVLPNVLTPELIHHYATNDTCATVERTANANVAAYTKDGVQQLWQQYDIPTPPTVYIDPHVESDTQIAKKLTKLEQFDTLVVSKLDGSGGYGIEFVPTTNAFDCLYSKNMADQELQVQGYVPTIFSPGFIVMIDEHGNVSPLITSLQRFSRPGAHAGNYWYDTIMEDLNRVVPDFIHTNLQAAQVLSQHGVRGNVNMDSLLLSQDDADKLHCPTTLMREANIRPGGSSVLNRMREGIIDGKPIKSMMTSTKVHVPKEIFFGTDVVSVINNQITNADVRAVIYNYNPENEDMSLALCSNTRLSPDEFESIIKEII